MGESKKTDASEQPHAAQRRRWHSIRRTAKRIVLVFALVLLTLILYILWFMAGRPQPTVDYIAMLNETTRPEGLTEENNAWPYYERAIQQYAPHAPGLFGSGISTRRKPWFDDFNEPEQRALQRWIADNGPAWQSFVQATEKRHCWREYKRIEGAGAVDILDVPTLRLDIWQMAPLRMLMFLGVYRIRSEAYAGQTAAALQDCLVLMRAGLHWSQTGSLLDSLLGLGMAGAGHEELLKVLARAPADGIDWRQLQVDLADAYSAGPLEVHMELEKLMTLDVVQHTFTRGGLGGGHMIPRFVWPWVRMHSTVITMSPLSEKPRWRQRGLHLAMALTHARRDATISECATRYEQIERILAMTPYQLSRSKMQIVDERPDILNNRLHFGSFFQDTRYFMVELSAGVARNTAERQWQLQAQHEATRAVLAIKRWQSDRGRYPENLDQLIQTGLLKSPPLDPYNDTALVYRQTDDGFTLYSLGRNMKDDGGASLIDPKAPWRIWGTDEGGDAVFWPVP